MVLSSSLLPQASMPLGLPLGFLPLPLPLDPVAEPFLEPFAPGLRLSCLGLWV